LSIAALAVAVLANAAPIFENSERFYSPTTTTFNYSQNFLEY